MNPQHFTYKRALLSFMAILLIFLMVTDVMIVSNQRRQLVSEVKRHWQSELDRIGVFITESLLKHEYAAVENSLIQWVKESDDIVEIKATAPNNFVLMQYRSATPSPHIFSQEKKVLYGGKDLLALKVVRDFAPEETILRNLQLQLIAGSIVLIIILGMALWFSIRRMALRPLEMEIAERRHAEELLQRVKDELESKVQERTRELSDINENLLLEITERKKAESASKESEQKYRAILDNARDGILLADIENKKFYEGNKMISQMLGYSQDEIKDLGVSDIHPEEQLPYVIEQFNKQAKRETTMAKDIPVKRKDGSIFYADINSSPLTVDGKTYLVGIFRDITERKKAEEEIIKEKQKFESIVDKIGAGLLVLDSETRVIWANDLMQQWFGTIETIKGKYCYELLTVKNPREQCAALRVIESGKIEKGETFVNCMDGTKRFLQLTAAPIKDKDGRITQFIELVEDVTEIKNAEAALRLSE